MSVAIQHVFVGTLDVVVVGTVHNLKICICRYTTFVSGYSAYCHI